MASVTESDGCPLSNGFWLLMAASLRPARRDAYRNLTVITVQIFVALLACLKDQVVNGPK
jgi:hypothetical protein